MGNVPKGARLAERIREYMAMALQKVKDPRIGFVTVTDVRLTGDNDRATIYWTVLPDSPEEREKTTAGLKSAKGLLRSELAHALGIRNVPELVFTYDDVAEQGRQIDEILHSLHKNEHPNKADDDFNEEETAAMANPTDTAESADTPADTTPADAEAGKE